MTTLPTVFARERTLDAAWLRELCASCGADDVGFVSIDRAEIAAELSYVRSAFGATRKLISVVVRMLPENIRSPARSLANKEFHTVDDEVTAVQRRIVERLAGHGVRAVHTAMGFPMEAERWPNRMWVVSHKLVAEAAGLGRMGIHRNVIHPRFGNFVLLGTVLIDHDVDEEGQRLDYEPCLHCKLCVAACPVGAIGPQGQFDFSACYTHNYREFMGGFGDWVGEVADSRSRADYERRVAGDETVSMWQSLSFGANYKAAYCMAVCPAGDDVIAPFHTDRAAFVDEVVRPLQSREERVYAVPGSDADAHVRRRFPHKRVRPVRNTMRPTTVAGFLAGLSLVFQRVRAEDVRGTWHFTFHGSEERTATVRIADGRVEVTPRLVGTPDLAISADADTWLRFLRRRALLPWFLLTRRIRLRGSPRWLATFGNCFLS